VADGAGGDRRLVAGSLADLDAFCAPDVAYVVTHHPRTALTFIDQEIRELENAGGRVTPIAINVPGPDDLRSAKARATAQGTVYLKAQGAVSLTAALVRTWLRHPAAMTSLALAAFTSARLDLPLAARRLVHLAYACSTWRIASARGIRHFHAHFGQTPATVAWFAASIGTFSTGQVCTWSFTIHGFQDFADDHVTRLDLKTRSASFVVCVSDFTRAQLCRVTDPTAWEHFHVVRCGIDIDAFPFRPPARLANRPPRVVTVARVSAEKGHLVLLEATKRLVDQGIDLELRIIGDGPSAPMVQRVAADLGLGERVAFVGELQPSEVSASLREADLFCLPSFAEGIPVSIMEAMAVGVPVITTYVGGIPELAVDGETALVVPPGNAEALATALRRLIEDDELRLRLASAARRAVCERHDIESNVALLRKIFSTVPTTQAVIIPAGGRRRRGVRGPR
jgi:glycosyltransferase involved in cell wall biosynthesis